MNSILSIINEIRAVGSSNAKKAILARHEQNATLKRIAFLTYNSTLNFYVRKIPKFIVNPGFGEMTLEEALEDFNKLNDRVVTGGRAISMITQTLERLSAEDAEVYCKILERDWDCGVSGSTLNKIWPGVAHEYPVLLCQPLNVKNAEKMKFPAIAQIKYDGMRVNARYFGGEWMFFSRNGRMMDCGNGILNDELTTLAKKLSSNLEDFVFDGELLAYEKNGSLMPRKKSNGLGTKAVRGTITTDERECLGIVIWDIIKVTDFVREKSDTPYHEILNLIERNVSGFSRLQKVWSKEVNNWDEVDELFDYYHGKGEEGLIIKSVDLKWSNDRVPDCIKIKAEQTMEVVVTEVIPGTPGTKYEGQLGAVMCTDKSGRLKVKVGSGWSDDQRATLMDKLVGTIIEVEFNEVITNRGGGYSLFLPRLSKLRPDKSEPDTLKVK